jgi:hypothetical protein
MLEKLLGVGPFDGFIDHLAHHQTIFLIFPGRFSFLYVVWIVAFAFFGMLGNDCS